MQNQTLELLTKEIFIKPSAADMVQSRFQSTDKAHSAGCSGRCQSGHCMTVAVTEQDVKYHSARFYALS